MSYDEVERQNYSLCMRTVEQAGTNHIPVPQSITPNVLVQGAMDNYDHKENTKSGIGGTHDTVMVLFQNTQSGVGGTHDTVMVLFQNTQSGVPMIQ